MTSSDSHVEALFFEGNQKMANGDMHGAEQCFRQALTIRPDFGEVHCNLGYVLEQAKNFAEAERHYRHAILLLPDTLQVQLNLCALLLKQKRFYESETLNRHVLHQHPDSAAAWSYLGVLLACTKREDEAEHCQRTAQLLDPSYDKASFNLSYLLLRQGRMEEGWQRLQGRMRLHLLDNYLTCPFWQGEDLQGKSILIGFEAGHGDMIMFFRYAAILKEKGARHIAAMCHPGLKTLFQRLPAVDEVFSFEEPMSASCWDFWTLPLSLPHFCATRMDTIPAKIPYLSADPVVAEKMAALVPKGRPRVGLAWKGNANFENDADRSLPSLDALAPLSTCHNVQFISLQKGPGENEVLDPPAGLSVFAMAQHLHDFNDTAGLISQLDLVISVDSAVAHLAGSMGIPCWVLLPDYKTCWRWLTDRSDSPWYPGMRLFRQAPDQQWQPLIVSVAEALKEWQCDYDRSSNSGL